MVSEATRLLVVDDDPDAAPMVRRMLQRSGHPYIVDAATDTRRVRSLLGDGAYHAWMLDHRLSGGLGEDFLGALPDRARQPPVVVMSASPDLALADRYLDLGAADFLDKNEISPGLLDRTLRFAIAQWRARRLAEAETEMLRRRERMAAICRFAAGVAHEYNNLDAVVLAGVERLFLRADRDPEAQAQLERIMAAIERGRRISRTLLQLGRTSGPADSAWSDLHRQIADETALLRVEAGHAHVDLVVQATAAECPVALAPGEAHQLLSQLVGNAIHAVHGVPHPQVRVRLEREPESVTLTVADNGIGIEPEDQPRIFEPFFTRKGGSEQQRCYPPAIEGAGLGLSVCLALVERAGGRITVCSATGAGTTVLVRLPLRPARPTAPPAPQPEPADASRPLRIALLEDNDKLNDLLGTCLREMGWEVRSHTDPQAFLAAWDPAWADLLLLDWTLPGIGGGEVLQRIADPARGSPLRVVVMSGGIPDLPQPFPPGLHLAARLEKPFRMQTLMEAIKTVA